ncbi:MAG: Sua5/YciO/YrdC/YwlC family protein [Aestuariibacter sp.]
MQKFETGLTEAQLIEAFNTGALFAYPTEAVFGFGCDPDNEQAVTELCALKQRSLAKGLILIADNYSRLLPYVNDNAIPMDRRTEIFSSWPGAITWLLPKSDLAPNWITGEFTQIAVRVTTHPVVKELCQLFEKPLVSTSANISGQPPICTVQQARQQFADKVICIAGSTEGRASPSVIKDGISGQILRG